jgi:hypothetical protein
MRRFTLTITAGIAALVLLPAAALAGTHARHHQRRHHHVHHAIVRHDRFGAVTNPTENAGTVQSFTGGVLTLSLANGSTVSGTVNDGTEIECEMADVNDMNDMRADGDRGGAHGSGDNSGPGGGGDQGSRGGDNGGRGGDNGDRGDDNGNDNQNCMAADLVAGAVVRSAELRVSSGGAIWDKVELIG